MDHAAMTGLQAVRQRRDGRVGDREGILATGVEPEFRVGRDIDRPLQLRRAAPGDLVDHPGQRLERAARPADVEGLVLADSRHRARQARDRDSRRGGEAPDTPWTCCTKRRHGTSCSRALPSRDRPRNAAVRVLLPAPVHPHSMRDLQDSRRSVTGAAWSRHRDCESRAPSRRRRHHTSPMTRQSNIACATVAPDFATRNRRLPCYRDRPRESCVAPRGASIQSADGSACPRPSSQRPRRGRRHRTPLAPAHVARRPAPADGARGRGRHADRRRDVPVEPLRLLQDGLVHGRHDHRVHPRVRAASARCRPSAPVDDVR